MPGNGPSLPSAVDGQCPDVVVALVEGAGIPAQPAVSGGRHEDGALALATCEVNLLVEKGAGGFFVFTVLRERARGFDKKSCIDFLFLGKAAMKA